MPISVDGHVSLARGVLPRVTRELDRKGFALVMLSAPHSEAGLEARMGALIALIGQSFGRRLSLSRLAGEGDSKRLPIHVEGIYGTSGICPTFALGCIVAATSGGETRLFDARKAGSLLKERHPNLAEVRIRYRALAYPAESAEYPLVLVDPRHGPILRYRGLCPTNEITHFPDGVDSDHVYQIVDSLLTQCVLLEHAWQRGEVLFVNNHITLHDRLSYTGRRVILRARIDEPAVTDFSY